MEIYIEGIKNLHIRHKDCDPLRERPVHPSGRMSHDRQNAVSLKQIYDHESQRRVSKPRLTDWLTDWLIHSLTRGIIVTLTDWLTHSLTHSLADSLTHSLTVLLWLTDWLTHSLTVLLWRWLTDWLTHSLTHSIIVTLTDWLTDWLTHSQYYCDSDSVHSGGEPAWKVHTGDRVGNSKWGVGEEGLGRNFRKSKGEGAFGVFWIALEMSRSNRGRYRALRPNLWVE
jgi:hypothetical protein